MQNSFTTLAFCDRLLLYSQLVLNCLLILLQPLEKSCVPLHVLGKQTKEGQSTPREIYDSKKKNLPKSFQNLVYRNVSYFGGGELYQRTERQINWKEFLVSVQVFLCN